MLRSSAWAMKRAVLGAGELLLERVEAEAVVDALVEDAAEAVVALDHDDGVASGVAGGDGRGEAGGAAADDDDVIGGERGGRGGGARHRDHLPSAP